MLRALKRQWGGLAATQLLSIGHRARPGGEGSVFNGAELLALAIGGCFCNDLQYVANDMEVGLGNISLSVTVEMAGNPLLTTGAKMAVSCEMLDGSDPQRLIERTRTTSMVANSLQRGIPVAVQSSALGH